MIDRLKKEETDAKGNQSMGDVSTSNISISSPRIAKMGTVVLGLDGGRVYRNNPR